MAHLAKLKFSDKQRTQVKMTVEEHHEPSADLADLSAVVFAEIGNRLVIGNQAAAQPHDLDIAPRLPFQATARLHPVVRLGPVPD